MTPASPDRFKTARTTLFVDWLMTWFIKVGGLAVILAVLGIMVFIAIEVVPLFGSASVRERSTIELPKAGGEALLLGVDEWGERPFTLDATGVLRFFDAKDGSLKEERTLPIGQSTIITAVDFDHREQKIAIGTSDGRFQVHAVRFERGFAESGAASVTPSLTSVLDASGAVPGRPVLACAYGAGPSGNRMGAVIQDDGDGKRRVNLLPFTSRRVGIGQTKVVADPPVEVTGQITGRPIAVTIDERGEGVLVTTDSGEVDYFFRGESGIALRQKLRPFADLPSAQQQVAAVEFILGDVSVVITNTEGRIRKYSLFIDSASGSSTRTFGLVSEFPQSAGPAAGLAPSGRNKCFLISGDRWAKIIHATSGATRWQAELPYAATHAVIGGKHDRFLLLDRERRLHHFDMDDPHPEGGFSAVFGRIWYEGKNGPTYDWQSSGATDDFEPKLSLVPLIFGTLKGTFYAMLVSVPIALLAAIYVSEFMHPRFKMIVKPTVEVMASLPSVVLGFLAALWLAPLAEAKVPSLIAVLVSLPAGAILVGWIWSRLPPNVRILVPTGYEFIAFTPALIVIMVLAWSSGPFLESVIFQVTLADGRTVADFRLWWSSVAASSLSPFEQRNSLVVGVVMGFAVIPIIFTIAEDAMSNVPKTLRSGSLALGASRWQTAIRVILPTASPGIFSALMIGLGRAIGETMIVVMATGNTPVMEMNPFNGMRTLSANIAVELPEAPQHSTLYRTLFLGAMLLFILTFIINTAAEMLRQHLREKYRTV
jgi:phosphate transport system permease protein